VASRQREITVYLALKHIHLSFVALSLLAYVVRGIWLFMNSSLLGKRWVRILQQIINAILLLSGIALAAYLSMSPTNQPWLMAKIIGLIAYVALGMAAFRAPSPAVGRILWVSGLVAFAYIVSVAIRKTPLGFFS
jgi:uncharacterized membrane protein SirB2